MPFTHKYDPKRLKDVVGQSAQLKDLKDKIANYSNVKSKSRKALLVWGPPGTGKTSSIHALADELGLELIEVNASDTRNTEGLEQKVLPAIRQQSLFSKSKIILIDEIDGLAGSEDRGGLSTVQKLIDESPFPMILTANDIWDNKFSSLRRSCTIIEYKAISFLDTINHLKEICEKEGIKIDDDAINFLARSSKGDLRSALTDLENAASEHKTINKHDVELNSEREREETIINALLKVFKTTNPDIALGAYDHVDEDIDKIFLWLDENLSKEYLKIDELAKAYDNMSLADVYFGRIRRWQYYRYYVYIYNLLSAGIALSKKEKNPNFVQYGPTQRILKIWMANQRNAKRKSIAAKIAAKTHASTRKIVRDMPYIRIMVKNNNKSFAGKFSEEYKLDDEEIEWLKK
jgi:replication factor C large subunit